VPGSCDCDTEDWGDDQRSDHQSSASDLRREHCHVDQGQKQDAADAEAERGSNMWDRTADKPAPEPEFVNARKLKAGSQVSWTCNCSVYQFAHRPWRITARPSSNLMFWNDLSPRIVLHKRLGMP
jgi:hypothetical protein